MSKPEDFKFDSRVRERLLRGRSLSAADLKQHLDALPDLEGEYELMNDTPQPAVTPARDHVEEPLVFDGIRRLQALSEPHSGMRNGPTSSGVVSSGLPPREPSRGFGSTLRSQAAPDALAAPDDDDDDEDDEAGGGAVADWEAPFPDSEDMK